MYEMNYSRKQDFIPPFFYSLLCRNNKICLPLMDLWQWQAASNSILLGTELRNKIQKEVKSTREVPGREKSFFFFFKRNLSYLSTKHYWRNYQEIHWHRATQEVGHRARTQPRYLRYEERKPPCSHSRVCDWPKTTVSWCFLLTFVTWKCNVVAFLSAN